MNQTGCRVIHFRTLASPIGTFLMMRTESGEIRTAWEEHTEQSLADASEDSSMLPELADRLKAYFDGDPVDFGDVPVAYGTRFQQACWRAARLLAHGRTGSYKDIAARAGSARAVRAVGQAMRRNPQPIITPCHRVITSSGRLGGFIGSDDPASEALRRKSWLLRMEGHRFGVSGEICGVIASDQLQRPRGTTKMC